MDPFSASSGRLKLLGSVFETMYFLQKTDYYKKIYYLSRILSTLITCQLVISSDATGWAVQSWLDNLLGGISLPAEKTSSVGFSVYLGVVLVIIAITTGLMLQATYQISNGTVAEQRAAKLLRFCLALVSTFADPFFTILLMIFACSGSVQSGNGNPAVCSSASSSSSYKIVMMALSAVAFLPFGFCLLVANLMHINDPLSKMILARVHSRVELLQMGFNLILAAVFLFFPSYSEWMAAGYLVAQLIVTACLIVFQPYYHTFTNDLFAGISTVTVWTGICFAAWVGAVHRAPAAAAAALPPPLPDGGSSSNKTETIIYAVFYVGIIPMAILGFFVSRLFRKWFIQRTVRKYGSNSKEIPKIQDDDFFSTIRNAYDRNISMAFYYDISAALVEVQTRFLQYDTSPRALNMADHILRSGLLRYPQSAYLRLQYLTFLITYRENTSFASLKMEEMAAVHYDLDLQYSLLRKRRELERKRQVAQLGHGTATMDSISFEELKKKIRDARESQEKAIELRSSIWSSLYRKLGGSKKDKKKKKNKSAFRSSKVAPVSPSSEPLKPLFGITPSHKGFVPLSTNDKLGVSALEIQEALDSVAPVLEQLQQYTNATTKEYENLLSQCPESKEVITDYARFLRHVKHDYTGAEELEEKIAMLNLEREEATGRQNDGASVSKSATSSVTSMDVQIRNRQQNLINREANRVAKLKSRLQLTTLIIALASTAAYVVFVLIEQKIAENTFFNNSDSGMRRIACSQAQYDLRTMHMAALDGDLATFNTTSAAIMTNLASMKTFHYNQMFTYKTSFQPLWDYMTTQSVLITTAGENSTAFKTIILSPDEMFNRIMDMGQIACQQPMSKFVGFKMNQPQTFVELHFVFANAMQCLRSMDTTTSTYLLITIELGDLVEQTVIWICIIIILVEAFAVIVVIRPIVARMFQEFWESMARLTRIPLPIMNQLSQISIIQLKKSQVIRGENDAIRYETEGGTTLSKIPSNYKLSLENEVHTPNTAQNLHLPNGFNASPEPAGLDKELLLADDDLMDVAPEPVSLMPVDTSLLKKKGGLMIADVDTGTPGRTAMSSKVNFSEKHSVHSIHHHHDSSSDSEDDSSSATFSQGPGGEGQTPGRSSEAGLDGDDHSSSQGSVSKKKPKAKAGRSSVAKLFIRLKVAIVSAISKILHDHDSGQDNADKKFTRKLMIVIVYTALLLLISICIIIFSVMALASVKNLERSSPEMNCGGRRRTLFDLCTLWAREIMLTNMPKYSLVSPDNNVFQWNNETMVRCMLRTISGIALLSHNSLLYGYDYAFGTMPQTRGIDIDPVGSPCSCVTTQQDLFTKSVTVPGFVNRNLFSDFYFAPGCLTKNEFTATSYAKTSPRMNFNTVKLTDAGCVMYNTKNPLGSNGMHRLYDEVMSRFFFLSAQPFNDSFIADSKALVALRSNGDIVVGLLKAVLMIQEDNLDTIDSDKTVMTVLYALILFSALIQYAVLGKRIESLMKSNLEMLLTSDRMIGEAVAKMKKQGYDISEFEDQTEEEQQRTMTQPFDEEQQL